ncbi:hypothetical protein APX70_06591 [Pseudomonas syringae pv. maculicola]|uniref:Uncharacterized protein n=1 Tax=Pseudomonas syringae pv. maculicola TaxID=59511 RepID=A0A3M2Y5X7_PSEYM|nr:hypothetical protein APX70_06591 [Pseudomonas syringae pv. maculicola]
MLANRRQQSLCGHFFRPFDGHAVAKDGAFDLGLLAAVALGQYQAVVKRLVAGGAPGGPGDLAVAVSTVDADAIVVGNEAFIEADVVVGQWRHEHLDLYRVFGVGDEFDFGVDVPQVIGFVFAHGYAERQYLIGRDRNAQGHEGSDQDFQMECK